MMMTTRVKQRLAVVGVALVAVIAASVLVINGLRGAAAFFVTPSELLADVSLHERTVRVGGLVEDVRSDTSSQMITFRLVDDLTGLAVRYTGGEVPNLFYEGQCVIAYGRLEDDVFQAQRLVAKHDETYTPREISQARTLARRCGTQ